MNGVVLVVIEGQALSLPNAVVKRCPQDAILGKKKEPHTIIQEKCIQWGICEDVCKFDSVRVQ